jgi:ParB family chromosome partitioning protein
MVKIKGLGRGLDALLSGNDDAKAGDVLMTLGIDALKPGRYQPRTRMNSAALQELADSIKAQGVMQPVLVRRPEGDGRHEIIAGERRWRAATLAGLREIPALVRDVPDQAAAALSLIENIQREDLNPLEEAQGFQRLIDDFKLTHDQVSQAVGRSRSAVTNLLRLMQLAKPVQDLLLEGALDMGHGRALLALAADRQVMLAKRVAAEGLSVRDTERLVQEDGPAPQKNTGMRNVRVETNPDIKRLETDLADKLGATVRIQPKRKGAGRIVIDYGSLDQLDGILARLK